MNEETSPGTEELILDAAPAEPPPQPTLGGIVRLVLLCSFILGIVATVATVLLYALHWIPQQITGPVVLGSILSCLPWANVAINDAWLNWVRKHGAAWGAGTRALVRLCAVLLVPFAFYAAWSALKPIDSKIVEEGLGAAAFRAAPLNGALTMAGTCVLWTVMLGRNAANRAEARSRPRPAVSDAAGHLMYFRSFKSDADPVIQDGVWSSFTFRTEEELLAGAMPRGTRFFAIGKPGEALPELGAERMYFEHDAWAAAALQMMQTAALVIVRPHQTPSLLWELQRIVEHVPPERFVIWNPGIRGWNGFRKATEGIFPQGLPRKTGRFMVFDSDWNACAFELPVKPGKKPLEGRRMLKAKVRNLIARARTTRR